VSSLRLVARVFALGLGMAMPAAVGQAAPVPPSVQQAIDRAVGDAGALTAIVVAAVTQDPASAPATIAAAVRANPPAAVQIAAAAAKAVPDKACAIALAAVSSLPLDERETQTAAILAAIMQLAPQAREQNAELKRCLARRPYRQTVLDLQSLVYAPPPASPR
jgi:hypothetical protein